jgi:hypothetical protein
MWLMFMITPRRAAGALTLGLLSGLLSSTAPAAQASPWRLTYHHAAKGDATGQQVVSAGAGQAWAVSFDGGAARWSMLRWNGKSWRTASLPGAFTYAGAGGILRRATSNDAAWLFAYASGTTHAWRYTGGRWVDLPRSAQRDVQDAAVLNGTDVWVADQGGTLTHWDGHAWQAARTPAPVERLAAAGPRAVWALGGTTMMRWDGKQWVTQPLPMLKLPGTPVVKNPRPGCGPLLPPKVELHDLAAGSAHDVWAVGSVVSRYTTCQGVEVVLADVVFRSDGKGWKRVPLGTKTGLRDVETAGGRVWVGAGSVVYGYQGGRWTRTALPVRGKGRSSARSLSAVPGTSRLLVYGVGETGESLIYERS